MTRNDSFIGGRSQGPNGVNSFNGDELKGTAQDQAVTPEGKQILKSDLAEGYILATNQIVINQATQDGSTQAYTADAGHGLGHMLNTQLGTPDTEAAADRISQQYQSAVQYAIGNGTGADPNHAQTMANEQAAGYYAAGSAGIVNATVVDPKLTVMYRNQVIGVNDDLFPGQNKVVELTKVLDQSGAKTQGTPLYIAAKIGAIELTPIGEIDRIILGVDPYTGEALSTKDRVKEAAITAVTLGASREIGALRELSPLIRKAVPAAIEKLPDKLNTGYSIYQGYQKESGKQ